MPVRGAARPVTRVVSDVLRDRIVRGHYAPGRHLPAAELAADLDVSRTPVREALLLLETEGLVVSTHNRGAFVRPLDRDAISRLYDVRALLEGFAARKAADAVRRLETGKVDVLWDAIAEHDRLIARRHLHAPRNIEAMMRANTRIHDTFVTWSGYPQLSSLIAQTTDRGVIYRAFDLFSRPELQRTNEFHRLIAERVVAGDADRAASLMAEHVFQSRDVMLARIDAVGGDLGAAFAGPRTDGKLHTIPRHALA